MANEKVVDMKEGGPFSGEDIRKWASFWSY